MEFVLAVVTFIFIIGIPIVILLNCVALIFRTCQLIYKKIISRNEEEKNLKMEEDKTKYWSKSRNIYEVIDANIIKNQNSQCEVMTNPQTQSEHTLKEFEKGECNLKISGGIFKTAKSILFLPFRIVKFFLEIVFGFFVGLVWGIFHQNDTIKEPIDYQNAPSETDFKEKPETNQTSGLSLSDIIFGMFIWNTFFKKKD